MKKEFKYIYDELGAIAREVAVILRACHCKTVALSGDLGAGKTTLVRALMQEWGVTELVTSPTFTYLNIYKPQGLGSQSFYQLFYHYDLYRISEKSTFFDLGLHEYLDTQATISLIEWPEIIMDILPRDTVFIHIILGSADDERCLTMTVSKE